MKRIAVLFLSLILLSCHKSDQGPVNRTDFMTGTLEEANINKDNITKLEKEISNGKYNIHSILILRNDKLLYEHYFTGNDAIFPNPVGVVSHARDSLHDCRSVTKSIVSACIGVAISQGKIKSVDDHIFDYFPEYKKYAIGNKASITIRNLLTMTAGLEWNEEVSYDDPANGERQMSLQPDVVDFVLSRKSVAAPGTIFNYSGGCTQLLAQLLKKATGISINDFAAMYIFEPLGIQHFNWYVRDSNTVWAPSGLRLRSIDMARFGQMYIQGGMWYAKQVVPEEWVKQSMQWTENTGDVNEGGYGFQFWCAKPIIAGKATSITMADGNGGQRICMIPSLDLQIVITAGNYNEDGDTSDDVLNQYIFPAIIK